jgi:hypothetical protein
MEFWTTEGANVKESRMKDLISQKATLEEFFNEPTFIEEFYTQNPQLIEILSRSENIEKLIFYISITQPPPNLTHKQCCDYAFFSFTILSGCNPEIMKVFNSSDFLIEKLFEISTTDYDLFITSQGYYQTIIKNFFSDMNPTLNDFLDAFLSCGKKWVISIVNNLSQSNKEVIIDILNNQSPKMKGLQQFMFDYLLSYFLNEKFVGRSEEFIEEIFENVNDVFNYLKKYQLNYNFKQKYTKTLFSNKTIRNPQYSEKLYYFKLNLLTYLVSKDQIKTFENPYLLLNSCRKFKSSVKYYFYLLQNLSLFICFSEKEEFVKNCCVKFINLLFEILKEENKKDIIHNKIFAILQNLKNLIDQDKNVFDLVTNYLVYYKNRFILPNKTKKNINEVSLSFIYQLLKEINMEKIENKQKQKDLSDFKIQLENIFTPLCMNEKIQNDISKEKIVVNVDFNLFNKNSFVEDKRFQYEEQLISNKPQKTENKNTTRNFNTQNLNKNTPKKNLFDNIQQNNQNIHFREFDEF